MIEALDTLYKRDTTGKIRCWTAQFENDQWRVVSGILDGNLVVSEWRIAKPKNVGKKNEKTADEQAVAESNAKHKKQLEKGYFIHLRDIDNVVSFKPMLANDYAKLKKPLNYPILCQPKLDGIRCIARADGLWSRTGKAHLSIPHIWEALAPTFKEFPNLVLDGELYNHDLRDDFNKIVSLVRKSKPTDEDLKESAKLVQFHVYDTVMDEIFAIRDTAYTGIVRAIGKCCIQRVLCSFIENQAELDDVYGQYIQEGYEGQMIRLNALYENKRSKNLLKRKEFITEEYKVTGTEEGEGNWTGSIKKFNLITSDGKKFNAGVRGTKQSLANLLNQTRPDWATLRYFELSVDGIPRFPVVIDYGWGDRSD
jgi:DNA ligase-1